MVRWSPARLAAAAMLLAFPAPAMAEDSDHGPTAPLPSLPPPPAPSLPIPERSDEVPVTVLPPAPANGADAPPPEDETPAKVDAFRDQPLAVELQLGLNAPLGLAGLAIDYSLIPALALNAGVGLGLSGVQWGAGARVRVFRFANGRDTNHFAITCGAGVAGGAFDTAHADVLGISIDGSQYTPEPQVAHYHFDQAIWATTDVGFEMRFGPHFLFRPELGLSALLNPSDGFPVNGSRGESPGPIGGVADNVGGYVALVLGYVPSAGWR
jgi:hypothetical protein